jgi:hypothetical protein
MPLTPEQKTEITTYINVYRTKHQSPPLTWDDSIATFSQQWANYLLTNNEFKHSGNTSYGENLAYFQGYGNDPMTLLKKAVDSWYNEVSLYNYATPGFTSGTGHFTCLVWKSSTKYAMGIAIDLSTNSVDITMNTSPPGNVSGKYQDNVLPPIGSSVPGTVPLPVPVPVQFNKTTIIYALYNIINAIQANQSKAMLVSMINNLIAIVNRMS